MISSESGVFVCFSLPSLRCLTKTLQSSAACCPATESPPFPTSLPGLVVAVEGAGAVSLGGGCVRTVTVKEGVTEGVVGAALMLPTRASMEEVIGGCVGAGGEGVGAGGEGEGVTGDGVRVGGEVPRAGRSCEKLALMNLLRAAPMSKGETSTSTPSTSTSLASTPGLLLGVSWGAVVGCEGATGVESSCVICGLGGHMCAEPGLEVAEDLTWGAAGVLEGTGEEVLPSLSFPLLISLPVLTLPVSILL